MKTLLCVLALACTFGGARAQFSRSYTSGTVDPGGNFMGGTEMRVLATHKGRLFGGTETWKDDTTGTCDSFIGAQIVRLDAPTGPWRLDKHFNTFFPNLTGRERKRNEGITALESVVFRTDQTGTALSAPDTVLIAAARDFTGILSVYTRNDAATPAAWTETVIGTVPANPTGGNDNDGTIRSFIVYRDKVTGVDRIFAGSLPNGLISGAYDATRPGKIAWNTAAAEFSGFVGRPMAFAVCNGDLYCAIAPNIWKRNDGPNPTWTSVFSYPFVAVPGGSSGFRGLTTIKNPTGPGQALLAALEGTVSRIYRVTPSATLPYPVATEYDVDIALTAAFGYPGQYYVVANSEMTWVTEPVTADSVLTITLQHHPANLRDDAFYLTRKQVGAAVTYSLKRIDNTMFGPLTVLNSTRAIAASPFVNDADFVYVGGYDADDNPSHNTAYALRASKTAFFNPAGSTPVVAGLKHRVVIPSLTDAGISNDFGYHQTFVNTAVAPRNKLFLFLPGSNSSPFGYDGVQKLAAEQGYHALGLSYSNATISPLCAGSSDSLCFDKVRGEVIDGTDRTPLVAVDAANSITNRVLRALQYLHTNFPTEGWGQFYSGNAPDWTKIAVAGHSQGGGHAAFIAKQTVVDRAVLFAAPKDYFVAPLRKAAAWENRPSATPTCRSYALTHQADNQGCTPAQQLEIFRRLGIDRFAPAPAVFETSNGAYNNSHVLLSSLAGLTGGSAHNVVAVDVAAATICKVPYYTPAWVYMLTHAGCGVVTAATNPAAAPAVAVYPNPASGTITIAPPSAADFTTDIVNTLGQRVSATRNQRMVDVSHLPNGIYFVRVSAGAQRSTHKLLVQR
ncbi:T9SS type A sorting domain-containing protein [Hymenobacter sp.]|uniref:T9SS type A sorting domain-containing protein n=1 Tax=Hymenobacter sp. TaxID=1898978 RepID=UPI00286BFFB2|nr:T9SS type A sorting domain-containing protein [Hymenobacter sp.]